MTNDLIIFKHHEIQFWNEIRIRSVLIEHVMLSASRAIYIPECLTRKVLYLTILFWRF